MSQSIVLVHGIFNSSYVFYCLKKRLEAKGWKCFTPDLKPFDCRKGIENWALQLKNAIDKKYGENHKIILIGFSMGGIAARYYLQNLEGHKRVGLFITISSPHYGSYLAYLYPGKGTRQLRPGNNFLDSLEKGEQIYHGISLYSYWTPFDLMIIPATSSVWKIANNKRYFCLFHLQMLFDKPLAEDICKIIFQHS